MLFQKYFCSKADRKIYKSIFCDILWRDMEFGIVLRRDTQSRTRGGGGDRLYVFYRGSCYFCLHKNLWELQDCGSVVKVVSTRAGRLYIMRTGINYRGNKAKDALCKQRSVGAARRSWAKEGGSRLVLQQKSMKSTVYTMLRETRNIIECNYIVKKTYMKTLFGTAISLGQSTKN